MLVTVPTKCSKSTNRTSVALLVLPQSGLDLLADHHNGFFPCHARVFAMLIVDVAERNVGRIVLQQT